MGTGIVEGKHVDSCIDQVLNSSDAGQLSSFDPLTCFVGRVERSLEKGAKSVTTDVSKLIDRKSKTITSVTSELQWNYGDGLLTVNTPKSQAVTGFFSKAGTVKLGDIAITSKLEYGTVHVISLDGQPLATSRKTLVQAFSEEKMYGFRAENGVIKDVGRTPINVRDIQATVTFANSANLRTTALDPNGYAKGEAAPMKGARLILQRVSMFTILTR